MSRFLALAVTVVFTLVATSSALAANDFVTVNGVTQNPTTIVPTVLNPQSGEVLATATNVAASDKLQWYLDISKCDTVQMYGTILTATTTASLGAAQFVYYDPTVWTTGPKTAAAGFTTVESPVDAVSSSGLDVSGSWSGNGFGNAAFILTMGSTLTPSGNKSVDLWASCKAPPYSQVTVANPSSATVTVANPTQTVAVNNFPTSQDVNCTGCSSASTVGLDGDASNRLDLVWYGVWAVAGFILVLIMEPAWRSAWKWFR